MFIHAFLTSFFTYSVLSHAFKFNYNSLSISFLNSLTLSSDISVDLRIICPQKTHFFAKANHLLNIKGVSHCVNYISHWLTPIIILNITIK